MKQLTAAYDNNDLHLCCFSRPEMEGYIKKRLRADVW